MKRTKIAIDTETTGLRRWKGDKPFAVGVRFEDGRQKYWEWPVDPEVREPMIDEVDLDEIKELCQSDRYERCFWNLSFDVNMLQAIGVECAWPMHEGVFMAKACDNLQKNYGLKPMAKKFAEIPTADEKDLASAVQKCRRVAKQLGWVVAEDPKADKWLPFTLAKLKPRVAASKGLLAFKDLCKVYCLKDVERTMILCQLFEYGMKDLDVRGVYDFEMTLLKEVTLGLERRGMRVDEDRLMKTMAICRGTARAELEKLKAASGNKNFRVEKAKDVANLLFKGMGPGGLRLPVYNKTKTGQPKVDAEALVPHRHRQPMVESVLRYRANAKAISSFFMPYDDAARRERHGLILRTNWNQWGTLTGRFSSTNPSFQVISNPKTTNSKSAEFVVDVRQVFVPRPGCVWYCPDYSQVEVIIFADISGEPTMLEAIRNGLDIHSATANKIWGGYDNPRAVPAMKKSIMAAEADKKRENKDHEDYDWDSDELGERAEALLDEFGWKLGDAEASIGVKIHRKLAKSATFTKIFGGGWRALMGWINVSPTDAKAILRTYDEAFPLMTQKMREIERRGKTDRYVTNAYGRRLQIDPWYAYRAVNYLVQSAAADLMKRGMLKTERYLRGEGYPGRLILTIHDELIFEFAQGNDEPRHVVRICELMSDNEGVFKVATPVEVDKVTERWSLKEKFEPEAAA